MDGRLDQDDPAHRAARYRSERTAPTDPGDPTDPGPASRSGAASSAAPPPDGGPPRAVGRMEQRSDWVDRIVDQAIARGEFDNLPLAGKPLPDLTRHDPDWWLKAYVAREHITGVLPEALQLRVDVQHLPERLDALRSEQRVREVVTELNSRIVAARRQLLGGPPVVTPLRDVDAEVVAWRERRATR